MGSRWWEGAENVGGALRFCARTSHAGWNLPGLGILIVVVIIIVAAAAAAAVVAVCTYVS